MHLFSTCFSWRLLIFSDSSCCALKMLDSVLCEREREGESHTGCVIHVHLSLTYFKVNDECYKITKEIVKLDLRWVLSKELSCLGEL